MSERFERASARSLQEAVRGALYWVVSNASDVDAHVEGDVVVLTGAARTLEQRDRAITAAEGVDGVRVVVDRIDVGAFRADERSDTALAQEVRHLLDGLPSIPAAALRARVHRGVVTMTGSIPWRFERDTVLNLVAGVPGVVDVVDAVEVLRPVRPLPEAVREHVAGAFVD